MVPTLEEAILTAIEYEIRVRDLYKEAARGTADPIGRRVLNALGAEEQGHVTYLQAKLKEWREHGTLVPERLASTIPSPEAIARARDLAGHLEPGSVAAREKDHEIAFLTRALEVERETNAHYHAMVAALTGPGRELFRPFIAIEDGHLALVQAELDHVRGSGFYFGVPEFDLESA